MAHVPFSINSPVSKKITVEEDKTEKNSGLPILRFNDKQFPAFTGVSKNVLQFFLYRIGASLQDSPRSLSREMKLTLVLAKLKLNVPFIILAGMFGVGQSMVKGMFLEEFDPLALAAKDLVIWYNKATIKDRMPASFKSLFPSCRAIIDASEVECSRPPTPVNRVKMYSQYKSRFTFKYLVATAPSGEITFCVQGFLVGDVQILS